MLAFPGLVSSGRGDSSTSKVSVGGSLWWQSGLPPYLDPFCFPAQTLGPNTLSRGSRANTRCCDCLQDPGPVNDNTHHKATNQVQSGHRDKRHIASIYSIPETVGTGSW